MEVLKIACPLELLLLLPGQDVILIESYNVRHCIANGRYFAA